MANQAKPVKFTLNQLNYKYVKRTVLGGILLALGLAIYGSHYFTPEATYADTTTTNGTYNGTSYYVTTSTSDLNLDLTAKPDGNLTIAKQTATVTTNAPGGYQLYLSTSSTNANSNRLNLNGSTSATKYLSAASGTYSSPAILTDNSWGYALANVGSFNSSYTEVTSKSMKDYTDTNKFAKVPIQGSEQLIKSTTSANTSGDTTNIYYAAKAKYDTTSSSNLTDGTYSTTVAYTTIANASTTDTLTVSPTSGAADTANTITITTPLMAASGSLTASNITAKIGTYTCSSVSITSTSPLTFTCKTPTNLTAGTTYDVATTVSKYGKTYTKTSAYTAIYAFSVTMTPSLAASNLKTYVSIDTNYKCTDSSTTGVSSASATIGGTSLSNMITECYYKSSDDYHVRIRGTISKAVGTYSTNISLTANRQTYTKTLTNNFIVKSNTTTKNLNGKTYMQDVTASDCAAITETNATNGFYTYQVTDRRNSQNYYIRKFSDGKCWMVNNLYLAGGTTLTSTYSNVSESYTLPSSTSITASNITANGATQMMNNGSTSTGSYYNWCTATAGTGSCHQVTPVVTAGKYDICPKNWRLPTSGNQSTLKYILMSLSQNSFFANKSSGALALPTNAKVYWTNGGNGELRTTSNVNLDPSPTYFDGWWSSPVSSSFSTTGLYIYTKNDETNTIRVTNNFYKNALASVRCILPAS